MYTISVVKTPIISWLAVAEIVDRLLIWRDRVALIASTDTVYVMLEAVLTSSHSSDGNKIVQENYTAQLNKPTTEFTKTQNLHRICRRSWHWPRKGISLFLLSGAKATKMWNSQGSLCVPHTVSARICTTPSVCMQSLAEIGRRTLVWG